METKDHQQNLSWLEPLAKKKERGSHGEINDIPIKALKYSATVISLVSLKHTVYIE